MSTAPVPAALMTDAQLLDTLGAAAAAIDAEARGTDSHVDFFLGQLRLVVDELLSRPAAAERAGVFYDPTRQELRAPVATSIDFTPSFIPPHPGQQSAVPALVVTLGHPAVPRSTHFVLQVAPDLERLDAPSRFANAVKTARLRTPT